jgi:hypothetical protein
LPKLQEKRSALKRNIQHLKHENSLLFSIFAEIFVLLDPDPYFECGSESGSSNSNLCGSMKKFLWLKILKFFDADPESF